MARLRTGLSTHSFDLLSLSTRQNYNQPDALHLEFEGFNTFLNRARLQAGFLRYVRDCNHSSGI